MVDSFDNLVGTNQLAGVNVPNVPAKHNKLGRLGYFASFFVVLVSFALVSFALASFSLVSFVIVFLFLTRRRAGLLDLIVG